jgi:hypothetical protein
MLSEVNKICILIFIINLANIENKMHCHFTRPYLWLPTVKVLSTVKGQSMSKEKELLFQPE